MNLICAEIIKGGSGGEAPRENCEVLDKEI